MEFKIREPESHHYVQNFTVFHLERYGIRAQRIFVKEHLDKRACHPEVRWVVLRCILPCPFSMVREFNVDGLLKRLPCRSIEIYSCTWTPEEMREFFAMLDLSSLMSVDCRDPELNRVLLDILSERKCYVDLHVKRAGDWNEFRRMHEIIVSPTSRVKIHHTSEHRAWVWHRHLSQRNRAMIRLMVYACAPEMEWPRGTRPHRDILERVRFMLTKRARIAVALGDSIESVETWQ